MRVEFAFKSDFVSAGYILGECAAFVVEFGACFAGDEFAFGRAPDDFGLDDAFHNDVRDAFDDDFRDLFFDDDGLDASFYPDLRFKVD